MYILTNALENLLRNKGRNALIMSIMFIIIVTSIVALIINNTANAVIEDYQTRFSSEVRITPDTEKLRAEAMANATDNRVRMRVPQISPELLLKFSESDTLQKVVAYGSISANSETLTAIDQSADDSTTNAALDGGGIARAQGGGSGPALLNMSDGNFRLYGGYWNDFDENNRTLADDGQSTMPAADNECLVSEEIAALNNISVGDSIALQVQMTLEIPSTTDMTNYSDGDIYASNNHEYTLSQGPDETFRAWRNATAELKVVGVYDDLKDAYDNENMPQLAGLNHRNEILTTLDTFLNLRSAGENNISLNVTYFLKNPELLAEFESFVRSAGLSDQFIVSTDESSYNTIVKPVLGLKSITLTFMVVVLVLGAIILVLLTSIAVRERKYEIGVLRAMGMKKSRVSLGLWSEILVMTSICLVIGIGVGLLAAQPISNVLLSQQVEAASSNAFSADPRGGEAGQRGGGPMMISSGGGMNMVPGGFNANAQPLSEMNVSLNLITLLQIIGIAFLLATLAGLVSTSRITKYEPIKILMERN